MNIQQLGRQTWQFTQKPGLLSVAAVGGVKEGQGPLAADFDYIFPSNRLGEDSFEKAEQVMQQKAAIIALNKANLSADQVDCLLAGDLLNQITVSSFTARALGIPYLGLFAACSTATEGLALAGLLAASGASRYTLAVTGSHNLTAERQFRYPNEYGAQKPPYSQYTCTAAGAVLVTPQSSTVNLAAATIGRVQDLGVTDPFQMGAAMAPACADTILTHLRERNVPANYYDLIVSGDLGRYGRKIAFELLLRGGFDFDEERFLDCGCLIYAPDDAEVFAGGSGCGCSAAVGYGHLYRGLAEGRWHRILLAATGALLSPVANQQKESIPGISHAVALERE